MNLIFFTHPSFFVSQSMPRFATMLSNGMATRGHNVQVWTAQPRFFKAPLSASLKKWFGYIDQFMIFPSEVRSRLKKCPSDTLFVFVDNALGPWVPLVADRPHVVHCHDFLAQRSALGEIPENRVEWSGRQYQAMIRRGFMQGKGFISDSQKTREDLHEFLGKTPKYSEVVYPGLNQQFVQHDTAQARASLGKKIQLDLTAGYLLHVGGNQYYKNRVGVIEMYDAWRTMSGARLPLLLIGASPSPGLQKKYDNSSFKSDIHFLVGIEDQFVRLAYSGASVFLFPSLAEGFGWPTAEAMASGCPAITTSEAPMSEVAGDAGFLIPRRPRLAPDAANWAASAATVIDKVIKLSPSERQRVVEAGLANAKRFDSKLALDRTENIYRKILQENSSS